MNPPNPLLKAHFFLLRIEGHQSGGCRLARQEFGHGQDVLPQHAGVQIGKGRSRSLDHGLVGVQEIRTIQSQVEGNRIHVSKPPQYQRRKVGGVGLFLNVRNVRLGKGDLFGSKFRVGRKRPASRLERRRWLLRGVFSQCGENFSRLFVQYLCDADRLSFGLLVQHDVGGFPLQLDDAIKIQHDLGRLLRFASVLPIRQEEGMRKDLARHFPLLQVSQDIVHIQTRRGGGSGSFILFPRCGSHKDWVSLWL